LATPAWWPCFHGTVNYECRTLLASFFCMLRRSLHAVALWQWQTLSLPPPILRSAA